MVKDLRQVIVVDLEATCYENHAFPPGEVQEIIEIGVCLLNTQTGERTRKQSLIVKPERSTVSPFCTRLTTITPEMVAGGLSLREACDYIHEQYAGWNRVWSTWTTWDLHLLRRECRDKNIRFPLSSAHLNAKPLFSLAFAKQREVGLKTAMLMLGEEMEGTQHRADDDAWNTARVLYRSLQASRRPESRVAVKTPPDARQAGLAAVLDEAVKVFKDIGRAVSWLASENMTTGWNPPAAYLAHAAGRQYLMVKLAQISQGVLTGNPEAPPPDGSGSAQPWCALTKRIPDPAALMGLAIDVFGGPVAALQWLNTPAMFSHGQKPSALLVQGSGRERLRMELEQIAALAQTA